MKAKIAVSTLSGKAYYILVDELKKRKVEFFSLRPKDELPIDIEVVLTTNEESSLIEHPNILILDDEKNPKRVIDEAIRLCRGKECYKTLVIGVDPGKTTGIAIMADADVLDALTVSGLRNVVTKILEVSNDIKAEKRIVKVGDGVPQYSKKLLYLLDEDLSEDYIIETVSEAGTNLSVGNAHIHGIKVAKDALAAVKIAERKGQSLSRRNVQSKTLLKTAHL